MLKQKIKQYFVNRCDEEYERELANKNNAYANWYTSHKAELDRKLKETDHSEGEKFTVEQVKFSHLRNYVLSGGKKPDIIIAVDDDGYLTDYAQTLIRDYFAANPDVGLVYGDEDRIDERGGLCAPWLKSDWAPDTFL